MANIVESIMKRMDIPERMQLSEADRTAIHTLVKSIEALKLEHEAEKKCLEEIRELFQKAALAEEEPAENESSISIETMKKLLEESMQADQIKALLADRTAVLEGKANATKAAMKDEELLKALEVIQERQKAAEERIMKKIGSVKIMAGISIWATVISLGVLIAYILQFI